MLRPEVFLGNPGKMNVSWYDFSMVAFDLCQRFHMMTSFFRDNPHEREDPGKSTVIALLNTITPLCNILVNDNERYKLYLEDDSHTLFIRMMDMSQLIVTSSQEAQIIITIRYAPDAEERFKEWFDKHGVGFEGG